MDSLTQFAINLIGNLGYSGLAIGLILDTAGVPIPSELLLLLSGAAAAQGMLNIIMVIIVGTLAQTAGGFIAYAIGAYGGKPLVERYGRYVLISQRELDNVNGWFAKYGSWLILFGHCLPIIRTYVSFPAGITRMSRLKFFLSTVTGSLIWSTLLSLLGYLLGEHVQQINNIFHRFSYLIIAIIILAVGYYLWHHFKKPKHT